MITVENIKVVVNGVVRFECGTMRNAGTVVDHLNANLADATVELITPKGETLANPSRHEALEFLVAKGYAVKDEAAAVPEKAAAVRKVTARTTAKPAASKTRTTRTAAAPRTTTRKKVAAARK